MAPAQMGKQEALKKFKKSYAQQPFMFAKDPVDIFREHVWIAPFYEDDIRELADTMLAQRDEAGQAVFPLGGTRVFAYPAPHFAVADGHPPPGQEMGFIYLNLRMASGRTAAVKKAVGDALIQVLHQYVDGAAGCGFRRLGQGFDRSDIGKIAGGGVSTGAEFGGQRLHALLDRVIRLALHQKNGGAQPREIGQQRVIVLERESLESFQGLQDICRRVLCANFTISCAAFENREHTNSF